MRKFNWALVILISVLLISYSVSVASCTAASSSSGNWPMFRNDPSRSGTTNSGGPANSAELLWNFTTMQGVLSSPAAANGYVWVGSEDGAIYCLNSSSGQLVWYFSTESKVDSSPAICDGCVYVGCEGGNVYALNAANGDKLWNYTTGGEVYSSPAVVNEVVYVGSYDGNVYALNASNGVKLWSCTIGTSVDSSPAVVGGVVYVSSDNYFVYALNSSTGSEIWSSPTGSTVSSPSVSNGCVYIGTIDGYVCCLNASNGVQIWRYQTQDAVTSSPAVAYGCVYVGSEDNNVYCLNASDGLKIWQSRTGYWVWSSPLVAAGNVYVGSDDYNVYCINASTGAKEWSYETGNFVESSPAIFNNTLFVGSDDNNLYAFALYNSTAETVSLQSTSSLPWTTIALDATAFAVAAVIIFAAARIVHSNRRGKRNVDAANVSGKKMAWFQAHADALCVLAILGFSAIFFVNLGSGALKATDEQTYSQWAFHMVKSGDYLTPWAFGIVNFWIGKPPLNMWLMSLAYQVFGVNNFASRIWSAVFGALSLVLVFFLGKKLYNSTVGLLSALVLGTFTTFYLFARLAMTDVPLIFFILASIYFFVLTEKTEKTSRYAALSGVFFGLALMTKQIEALLVPLILLFYVVATNRSVRFLFTKQFGLFLGVGLLVFSPWLIYMSISFGGIFWQGYFGFNVVMRTVSPVETHSGGYLYYFSYIANNENLPWVILLPFAAGLCVFNAVIKRVKEDSLILLWMLTVLLVFTFAQTKLFWYILPAFPAFAVAISSFLYQLAKKCVQLLKKLPLFAS